MDVSDVTPTTVKHPPELFELAEGRSVLVTVLSVRKLDDNHCAILVQTKEGYFAGTVETNTVPQPQETWVLDKLEGKSKIPVANLVSVA